jgi:beta-glucosidase
MNPLHAKAEVITGASFWATADHPELGAPELVLTDGPHGLRRQRGGDDHLGLHDSVPATCFPPAVGLSASWDVGLLREVGRALGVESKANGVAVLLGPGVNLKRSPLCGRNFEYFSEDPLLSGALGAAHVAGVQSEGVGASVKHFVANNQETARMQVSAEIDERTLRELYLPAFERVVKQAAPATVMCSYNRVNGVFSAENRWLLTELLRDEWGYEGLVVSDWGAVHDRVEALKAGLDLAMPGPRDGFVEAVVAAVEDGSLSEDVLDRAVARIGKLATVDPGRLDEVDLAAHHELARRVAEDCVVLLKNDGVLPFGPTRIAVGGPFAENARYQGGGSSHVNATWVDSPLAELKAIAADLGAKIVRLDEAADVAVLFLGLEEDDESEGFDRTSIGLPAAQLALIKATAAQGVPVVVVLSHGGTVLLEGWHDDAAAILDASLLGQGGGRAMARILFGLTNPSGRLAETIPLRVEDNPAWLNFPGEHNVVRYGEGVFVGYRYFVSADVPVRYPFGHGLSYTTFASEIIAATAISETSARVVVKVANTGTRAGKHVVQLYVQPAPAKVRRPKRELRAFAKVELQPGESKQLEFELDARAFAHWDVSRGAWIVPAGDYRIDLAESALAVVDSAAIQLDGDEPTPVLGMQSTLEEWARDAELREELRSRLATNGIEVDLRMVESLTMESFLPFFGLKPEFLDGLG